MHMLMASLLQLLFVIHLCLQVINNNIYKKKSTISLFYAIFTTTQCDHKVEYWLWKLTQTRFLRNIEILLMYVWQKLSLNTHNRALFKVSLHSVYSTFNTQFCFSSIPLKLSAIFKNPLQ